MNWAEVIFPRRWTVAGVRLQPLCLGHALLLERLGSPLALWDAGDVGRARTPGPGDLDAALWVCSRPWDQARAGMNGLRMRLWMALRSAKWMGGRFERDLLVFAAYLRTAWDRPDVRVEVQKGARASGVPECLSLMRCLMGHFAMTLDEALSTPVAVACWLAMAYYDEQGGLRFETDDDRAFARHMARLNAEVPNG